jgi:hypothetical protein
MSYSVEQFKDEVILFNRCCGSKVPTATMSSDEIDTIITRQIAIVNEEVLETITALSKGDMVEVLDGIVDMRYTIVWLKHLLQAATDIGVEAAIPATALHWLDVADVVKRCQELFTPEVLLEAMRRIASNNSSKFTTDAAVAKEWADNAGFTAYLDEAVIDGVSFYCIKDVNGKIRKKAGFVGVTLGDLI